ncbi:MAG: transcription factor E [Euryarchaeota archaeon]|nr:transcription factor E [Euryarchaeota archaeon]
MLKDPVVQELITDITKEEEDGISIVECLINGKITDEEIAEETELRLNIVRRVLYKLYDAGIASYKRSKDPETQWYTYSWKFEENKIFEMLKRRNEEFSMELKECLEYEENNIFFECKNNGCRCSFEEASENSFICPVCGSELEFQDNSTIIENLKEEIQLLKNNGHDFNFENASKIDS